MGRAWMTNITDEEAEIIIDALSLYGRGVALTEYGKEKVEHIEKKMEAIRFKEELSNRKSEAMERA